MISEEFIIDVFCKERCPFYENNLSCNSSELCPFRNNFKRNSGGDKLFHLVTNDFKIIDPKIEPNFIRNDIFGIIIGINNVNKSWICMSLRLCMNDMKWSIDTELEIETTIDDPIENLKIIRDTNILKRFPAFEYIEYVSKSFGRRFYLGSISDYLQIQIKSDRIRDIIKLYNLDTNINFGNAFWTSSTGYDKYVCGLCLDYGSVYCSYVRDNSHSVLPIFLL